MKRTIVITEDGSPTLINTQLSEHYHSIHGAVTESKHIFIAAGLAHRQSPPHPTPLRVFEVGLGTGLNALLSLEYAQRRSVAIQYTSVELYPLREEEFSDLSYPELQRSDFDASGYLQLLHRLPWSESQSITPIFEFHKICTDLRILLAQAKLPPQSQDVIFFDAFSPETQPELWTPDLLRALTQSLAPKGVLTTYCAKGTVRRALLSCGLLVERLPGPPGKREILRATRPLPSTSSK